MSPESPTDRITRVGFVRTFDPSGLAVQQSKAGKQNCKNTDTLSTCSGRSTPHSVGCRVQDKVAASLQNRCCIKQYKSTNKKRYKYATATGCSAAACCCG